MSTARRPLSKRTRFEVFKRDRFACQYCGQHPPAVLLEIDHITPIARGGSDDEANLITACQDCNRGKAAVPLSVAPRSLKERTAQAQELEAQLLGYREIMDARAARIQQDAFNVAAVLLMVPAGKEFRVDRQWLASIKKFNERLGVHAVLEAADIALGSGPVSDYGRFLYFCKVCWNWIKESNHE